MGRQEAMALISPAVPINGSKAAPEASQSTPAGSPGLQPVETPKAPVEPSKPAEEAKPVEVKAPIQDERFKHLSQKEVQIQQQREQLKKDREAFEVERSKLKPAQDEFARFTELKKTNPVEAFKLLGFTETDFINWASSQQDTRTPAEIAADTARAEIQKDRTAQAKQAEEAQQQRNAEVLAKFDKDVTAHILSDKDSYEFCNFHGKAAEELIKEYVTEVLTSQNELISIKEAADAVEQYYYDMALDQAKLKKLAPKPSTPEQETPGQSKPVERVRTLVPKEEEAPKPKPPSRTITNRVTASTSSAVPKNETKEQKRQRLIGMLSNMGK
jgi:hypothetical protein